jgi:hypothetical protein
VQADGVAAAASEVKIARRAGGILDVTLCMGSAKGRNFPLGLRFCDFHRALSAGKCRRHTYHAVLRAMTRRAARQVDGITAKESGLRNDNFCRDATVRYGWEALLSGYSVTRRRLDTYCLGYMRTVHQREFAVDVREEEKKRRHPRVRKNGEVCRMVGIITGRTKLDGGSFFANDYLNWAVSRT